MADRTPNELADRLSIEHQHPSPSGKIGLCQCPQCPDLRAAAALLRRQGEQLDTLRAAIGDPDELRLLADTFDLPYLRRIADAVDALVAVGDPKEGR
jgi:hypothetical protein